MSRGSREHYDEEFKREAVHLLLISGKAVPQVAQEVGLSAYRLRQWQQDQLQAIGEIEVAGQVPSVAAVEQENRQLRRELEAVRRQRDLFERACRDSG